MDIKLFISELFGEVYWGTPILLTVLPPVSMLSVFNLSVVSPPFLGHLYGSLGSQEHLVGPSIGLELVLLPGLDQYQVTRLDVMNCEFERRDLREESSEPEER